MPAMDYAQVADLYDTYVQTELDVAFFLAETAGCQRVLELTSGTGRLSLPLLAAGVPLTCLDSSGDMLDRLRRRLVEQGLSAPVYQCDATSFELPERFDLALIPFHAFAEFVEPGAQAGALDCIWRHLWPGGRLLLTLHNPPVRRRSLDGQVHQLGEYALPDGAGTLKLSSQATYDPATALVTGWQHYLLLDADGRRRGERQVAVRFIVPERETVEELVAAHGFAIEALFGDYQHGPFDAATSPFMLYRLRRTDG